MCSTLWTAIAISSWFWLGALLALYLSGYFSGRDRVANVAETPEDDPRGHE